MATSTPWGPAQQSRKIAPGIMEYSTAGHGGIHLSESRLAQLPEGARKPMWAGRGWYEEDCDWAVPFLSFPAEFEANLGDRYEMSKRIAEQTIRMYYPELVDVLIKEEA